MLVDIKKIIGESLCQNYEEEGRFGRSNFELTAAIKALLFNENCT
jgi:hypothetical protein